MNCPSCGEPCKRDEAGVGVGYEFGPWECFSCGWDEWPERNWMNQRAQFLAIAAELKPPAPPAPVALEPQEQARMVT